MGIYAHGFVFVALGIWLGLNLTAGPLAMNYPKDVDSISTPAKVLEILQENIKVSARHSEVLGWFIFFSMLWVSNLLTSFPGVWKRLLPQNLH